jgi:ubiquinone/menaquinone biosynthesis C-methylase UbiE
MVFAGTVERSPKLSSHIWNFWSKHYEKLWVQQYSLYPTRSAVLEKIQTKLSHDNPVQILDMGCGTGQMLRDIEKAYPEYPIKLTGIDNSSGMIEIAGKTGTAARLVCCSAADVEKLCMKFDIIICTHSFPYYENKSQVIKTMARVLARDGMIIMSHATIENWYDKIVLSFVRLTTGHARYPSTASLLKMIEGVFICKSIDKVRTNRFMPSIYLYVLEKVKP